MATIQALGVYILSMTLIHKRKDKGMMYMTLYVIDVFTLLHGLPTVNSMFTAEQGAEVEASPFKFGLYIHPRFSLP